MNAPRRFGNSGRTWIKVLLWIILLAVALPPLLQWASRQGFFENRPKPSELSFNQPASVSEDRPVIISTDEKINQEVFSKAHLSVVNIVATTLSMNFWREIIPQQGQGSGFIIDPAGYILTNNHVVEKAQRLTVTTGTGRQVEAQLVGRDPKFDLAVIRIPESYVESVAVLGDSDPLQVGQKAIAIGNPFGLSHTMTTGIVSALNREIRTRHDVIMEGLIQTDAAINPGNSGGPLLNSSGEVIGINTAIFSLTGGYQGIGFAIPVNHARDVATQLISRGYVARPWLGISGITLSKELSKALKLAVDQGVLVVETVPEGPAAQAGIRGGDREVVISNFRFPIGGDVIISINDAPVTGMDQMSRIVGKMKVDEIAQVEVVRDGNRTTIPVRLKERP